jgi:hypothetical protein
MSSIAKNLEFENTKNALNLEETEDSQDEKINYKYRKSNQMELIKKPRDEKCLIVKTRKLPFSFDRKDMKRKFTDKTNFSNNM